MKKTETAPLAGEAEPTTGDKRWRIEAGNSTAYGIPGATEADALQWANDNFPEHIEHKLDDDTVVICYINYQLTMEHVDITEDDDEDEDEEQPEWWSNVMLVNTETNNQIGECWIVEVTAPDEETARERIRTKAWEDVDTRLNDVRIDIIDGPTNNNEVKKP